MPVKVECPVQVARPVYYGLSMEEIEKLGDTIVETKTSDETEIIDMPDDVAAMLPQIAGILDDAKSSGVTELPPLPFPDISAEIMKKVIEFALANKQLYWDTVTPIKRDRVADPYNIKKEEQKANLESPPLTDEDFKIMGWDSPNMRLNLDTTDFSNSNKLTPEEFKAFFATYPVLEAFELLGNTFLRDKIDKMVFQDVLDMKDKETFLRVCGLEADVPDDINADCEKDLTFWGCDEDNKDDKPIKAIYQKFKAWATEMKPKWEAELAELDAKPKLTVREARHKSVLLKNMEIKFPIPEYEDGYKAPEPEKKKKKKKQATTETTEGSLAPVENTEDSDSDTDYDTSSDEEDSDDDLSDTDEPPKSETLSA